MTTHTLYRFFDEVSELLYVGRTMNPRQRWRSHEKEKDWFNEVRIVTRETFETAEAVDAAERFAIATEGPRYNIALNPNRRADVPLVFERRAPVVSLPLTKEHATRLAAVGIALPDKCEDDPTICECAECHLSRDFGFDEYRSDYGWHPEIRAEIDRVERLYYEGDDLFDWYYDFYDIKFIAPGALIEDSKERPLPAYAAFDGAVATVWCPICLKAHQHVFASGAVVDTPLDAGCKIPRGGRYRIYTDWQEADLALRAWHPKAVA